MIEPNVLGNVSPAKFLFDSANTEIINLFRDLWNDSDDALSLMHEDAGTLNGQTYVVPSSRVFYLLSFEIQRQYSDVQLNIQSNTTADTEVGGTTKQRIFQDTSAESASLLFPHALCIKFVAGEYITPYIESGGQVFFTGWGVECDA